MADEPDDAEIEAIWEAAESAALNTWGPPGSFIGKPPNPYPPGSQRAEIWQAAYRSAYHQENH